MSEEKDWLGCPNSVRDALPGKIEKAVQHALDACFLKLVGTPEAQRDKWLYKDIESRVCGAMEGWIKEALDESIKKVLKK